MRAQEAGDNFRGDDVWAQRAGGWKAKFSSRGIPGDRGGICVDFRLGVRDREEFRHGAKWHEPRKRNFSGY